MLHILWILIKFILIILGILLGLALLAVILLLFCPVRYQARAVKETSNFKEAELEARVTWLFRAVGAGFTFQNGEGKLTITLFGISLETIKNWLEKLKGSRKKRKGTHKGAQQRKKSEQARKMPQESGKKKKTVKVSGDESPGPVLGEKEKSNQENNDRRDGQQPELVKLENMSVDMPEAGENLSDSKTDLPESEKKLSEADLPESKEKLSEADLPEHKEKLSKPDGNLSGLFTRIQEILSKIIKFPSFLWNKIISFIKDINKKIRNIKKTISGITDKLGWWKKFLTNDRTKAAIALVWKDAKGLIHHVLPTKVEGRITFGCEDPSVTGAALAVLGMTFPFHKNKIQVTPLFDGENQLTGTVSLKGRIYGIMFIKAAIEIYFNKNVKYVINRWKHKED